MKYRVVRDDGVVLAQDVENLFEAARIAKDLHKNVPRHEFFVRTDAGKLVKLGVRK